MKSFKKLAGLALAMIMALALMAPAMAAGNDGSITIDNAIPEQDYTAYLIFDLESYNKDTGAYAYKVNSTWADYFAKANAEEGVAAGEGLNYVDINDQGYVTWKKGADAAEFAQKALAYAKANKIASVADQTAGKAAEGETTVEVKFSDLALGYYLIDSSVGTLCSLDTTNPNVTITEKNEVPTVGKEQRLPDFVKIGDTVNYTITISVPVGAQKYQLVDTMGEGLDLNAAMSVSLKALGDNPEKSIERGSFTIAYTDNGFTIDFTQNFLDSIAGKYDIVVEYSAVINSEAGIANAQGLPSITLDNKAILHYGDDKIVDTENGHTQISIFQFPVVKTTSTGDALAGAQFELYTQEEGGTPIALVYDSQKNAYRAATEEEQEAEGFISAKIESTASNPAMVYGFGAGTYYLQETAAPNGYNKLADRVKVELTTMNLTANVSTRMTEVNGQPVTVYYYDLTQTANGPAYGTAPQIVNLTGAELPATGGIGTTIFYTLGGLLLVGSVILFVTKKRTGMAD